MFKFKLKVYYEDTDSGGVVYYANYLKFIERARTNFIQELGFTLNDLRDQHNSLFIVRKINCDYFQSAKLEDQLTIESKIIKLKKASFEIEQKILRDDIELFNSNVLIVCIDNDGRPKKIPDKLFSFLTKK